MKWVKREYFFKSRKEYPMPHLLEHQLNSFKDFLQMGVVPEKRKNVGLQEIFHEVFPLESPDRRYKLEFISYTLSRSRYTPEECKRRSQTFASPLRVRLRLVCPDAVVKEQEIYLGDIPLMTDIGSFIINGDERAIVSQLQRSPGVFFEEELHPTGKRI